MILERLIQRVELRVFDLGRRFWGDDPYRELSEQAEELSEALRRQHATLTRCQEAAEELRTRLASKEKQAVRLAARVQTYLHVGDRANAWQCALELDQVRHSLHEERPQLRRHLLACRYHQAQMTHLQRSLASIQEKLYLLRQGPQRRIPVHS